jgi:hypothetical protein
LLCQAEQQQQQSPKWAAAAAAAVVCSEILNKATLITCVPNKLEQIK